jgi:hypothetical protein
MTWLFSQALMRDYENSLCSREPVAEYSAEKSLDGEPFAQLNVMPTQHKFYRNDKMMDTSKLSQFGQTLRVLTESHGADVLTWLLAASLARTSVQQVKGRDSMEIDQDCGQKWRGLLAKYSPDTHSMKTAQCSLLEDSIESSVTLPRWGLMLDGALYQQPTQAHRINVTASGSKLNNWPTPRANDAEKRGKIDHNNPRNGLPAAVLKFPIPIAKDAKASLSPADYRRKSPHLEIVAREGSLDAGRLNPNWVEWLMGWPIGWTDLKPLVTGKYQEWQHQHGICWEAK